LIFPIFFFELISSTADLFDYKILMLDRPYYDSFQELNIFSTNNIIQGNLSILILWKQEVKHYLRRKSSDNLSEILKCLLCDKLFHFAELRCIIFIFFILIKSLALLCFFYLMLDFSSSFIRYVNLTKN
jgi:hypothetical protein